MRHCTAAQGDEVVAAFQCRHNATLRKGIGYLANTLGNPDIIVFMQLQISQRIIRVRIKACLNNNQLRLEAFQRRPPGRVNRATKFRATRPR